jgi:hypothetical protein
MTYQLSGTLGQFNDSALVIAAPKNAVEGEGLLSEEAACLAAAASGRQPVRPVTEPAFSRHASKGG